MTDDFYDDNELEHYGVKGMHWGQRKERPEGVSGRTYREARKDAKEYTQAKMFYGEGAGTRRKLINKSVETKAKRDPSYKKAFDYHVENTDFSRRAEQARSTRRRKDTVKSTAKTARGIKNIINGNAQYASLAATVIVGGATYAHNKGIDQVVMKTAKKTYKDVMTGAQGVRTRNAAKSFLRQNGIQI